MERYYAICILNSLMWSFANGKILAALLISKMGFGIFNLPDINERWLKDIWFVDFNFNLDFSVNVLIRDLKAELGNLLTFLVSFETRSWLNSMEKFLSAKKKSS